MKTNNFDHFNSIIDNYINGNITDYINELNKLNKINLIRFTLFLKFNNFRFELYVNGNNKIQLREISH